MKREYETGAYLTALARLNRSKLERKMINEEVMGYATFLNCILSHSAHENQSYSLLSSARLSSHTCAKQIPHSDWLSVAPISLT